MGEKASWKEATAKGDEERKHSRSWLGVMPNGHEGWYFVYPRTLGKAP